MAALTQEDPGFINVKKFVWYLEGQPDDYVFHPFIDYMRALEGVAVERGFADWHTIYEHWITDQAKEIK